MKKRSRLTFRGFNKKNRPVYEDEKGKFICDVQPQSWLLPELHYMYRNEFDGAALGTYHGAVEFVPSRAVWDDENKEYAGVAE